ncbi:MAG: dTDP-4-dehydrorhamnose reductase family protein [Methanomassiliicoccales archaeon]
MNMDVLVLGAYGMLGHRLLLNLDRKFKATGTVRSTRKFDAPITEQLSSLRIIPGIDASRPEIAHEIIRKHKPQAVVNCVGIVKQAEAAKDPITSITVNSMFPHLAAKAAKEVGATFIHFSTDCVFSGKKGNYSQNDIPDPVDLYGRSKLLGEVSDNGITIRSSLIGRELGSRNGLVEWFLSNRGLDVKGFRKAIFSGFTTHEMSKVVEMVLDNKPILNGVWQVASDPISKFDLINMINIEGKTKATIMPNDMVVCDRSLDGHQFAQATGYNAPSWDDMIKSMVKDFPLYETRG